MKRVLKTAHFEMLKTVKTYLLRNLAHTKIKIDKQKDRGENILLGGCNKPV